MAWMPSWEFPAIRMTASGTVETFGAAPEAELIADSLIFLGETWSFVAVGQNVKRHTTSSWGLHFSTPANSVKARVICQVTFRCIRAEALSASAMCGRFPPNPADLQFLPISSAFSPRWRVFSLR